MSRILSTFIITVNGIDNLIRLLLLLFFRTVCSSEPSSFFFITYSTFLFRNQVHLPLPSSAAAPVFCRRSRLSLLRGCPRSPSRPAESSFVSCRIGHQRECRSVPSTKKKRERETEFRPFRVNTTKRVLTLKTTMP